MVGRLKLFRFSVVFFFLFAILFTPPLYARTFSSIIAFGDSLTDHNGLNAYVDTAPEAWTNYPQNGGPAVWVEYMAAQWNAGLENYAIGGAKTDGHTDSDIEALIAAGTLPPLGLVGQINRFADSNAGFDQDDTLFTVWIGGNDLLEYIRGDYGGTAATLITGAINNIEDSLDELQDQGAEHILILSLPDISKSPYFDLVDASSEQVDAARELVMTFNSALEAAVDAYDAAYPDITVYRFNAFSFMNDLISGDRFANTTDTYLEINPETLEPTGNVNGDAENYLFWDPIHPTTRAHEILGEAVAGKTEDQDDDSSTCFITTIGGM